MRLLIIEDEIDIALSLKKSFEAESFAVDCTHDGEKGSYTARANPYDLIILDNMLPKKAGLEVCKELRQANITTPILMLSVRSEIPEKVTLLNAGIDDYVSKPYSFEELLARVYALLRRQKTLKETILKHKHLRLNPLTQQVFQSKKELYLTRKEFSLLELLLVNKGKVVSKSKIMEHVWNMELDPFSRSVETHILNIRKKLETKSSHTIIKNIPGRGYMIS